MCGKLPAGCDGSLPSGSAAAASGSGVPHHGGLDRGSARARRGQWRGEGEEKQEPRALQTVHWTPPSARKRRNLAGLGLELRNRLAQGAALRRQTFERLGETALALGGQP